MTSFKIEFKRSAEKDLSKLPQQVIERAVSRIKALESNPFPPQSLKLRESERLYRLRVGDYRIIYEVDVEIRVITIHYIRHRREVYRR